MKRTLLTVLAAALITNSFSQRLVSYFKPRAIYEPEISCTAVDAEGNILLGGSFQFLNGELTGGLVKIDPAGKRISSFNVPFTTTAVKIYPQSNEKIFLLGNYTLPDGSITNLVRLNSDGSHDPSFDIEPSIPINDIGVQSTGKIIVVGAFASGPYFTSMRLLSHGATDISFPVIPINANIFGGALAVGADDSFYLSDGTKVYKYNAEGVLDNTYSTGVGTEPASRIDGFSMLKNGRILIRGAFLAKYNGVDANNVARLTENGNVDTGFNFFGGQIGQSTPIYEISNGNVLIAGYFPTLDGLQGFVEVKPDGTLHKSMALVGSASTFGERDNKVYVSGNFESADVQPYAYSFQWTANRTINPEYKPMLFATYSDEHVIGADVQGRVIVGGRTEFIGTENNGVFTQGRVARLTSTGDHDNTFTAAVASNSELWTVQSQDESKYLIGGSFYGGSPTPSMMRLTGNGSVDNTFTTITSASFAPVRVMKIRGGKIYVGGQFSTFLGVPSGGVAAINNDGTLAQPFPGSPTGTLPRDIDVQSDGKVQVLGSAPPNIATRTVTRLNADGTLDTSFPTLTLTGNGTSLAIDADNRSYVGGSFTAIGGQAKMKLARVLPDGTIDATFNAGADFLPANADIQCLVMLPSGNIAVGGRFSKFKGTTANGFVVIDATGELVSMPDVSFGPGSVVRQMDFKVDALYVSGSLWSNDGKELAGYRKISFSTAAAPLAPEQLAISLFEEGVFNLTWNDKSTNEVAFILERSTSESSGFTTRASLSPNTTSMKDSLISGNVTYFYRIKTSGDGGESANSNTVSLKWVPTPPAIPEQLKAVQLNATQIDVTWQDKSSNERRFILERSIDNGTTFSKTITLEPNKTQFTDTPEAPHENYVYRIKAVGKYQSSPYTTNVNLSVILAAAETPVLKLYPNPTSDFIFATTAEAGSWELISTTGQVARPYVERTSDQSIIDVRGSARGLYVVKFTSESSVTLVRVFLK